LDWWTNIRKQKFVMSRPKGSRDRGYETRQNALIVLARRHLSMPVGCNASWRDLAAACQVSVSTMNHYFANRATLIAAIIEHAEWEGAPYLAIAARPSGLLADSILELATMLSRGFEKGMLALQVGLAERFADEKVSASYLNHHLEPVLAAIAARFDAHIQRGEMKSASTRFAAIQFLSPILVAHLHQTALVGSADYPMAMAEFLEHHVDHFVRAHAPNRIFETHSSGVVLHENR
jgi:AcrR family transcriptional regulator